MPDVDLKTIMAEGDFLQRVGDELVGSSGPATDADVADLIEDPDSATSDALEAQYATTANLSSLAASVTDLDALKAPKNNPTLTGAVIVPRPTAPNRAALTNVYDPTLGNMEINGVPVGDTGWRALTSWDTAGVITGTALGAGWGPRTATAGAVEIRRQGNRVSVRFRMMQTSSADPSGNICTLPVGFRPDFAAYVALPYAATGLVFNVQIAVNGTITRHVTPMATNQIVYGPVFSFTTETAWPTTLPGAEATVRNPTYVSSSATINLDAIGAVGDGVADDTVIVQNAVNAALAYNGTSTVVGGVGKTYKLTKTIDISGSGITITGGTFVSSDAYGFLGSTPLDQFPEQSIAPAAKGSATVTLLAPPVGLAIGNDVLIYTGSTSDAGGDAALQAPDSEINRITGITGNVVTLEKTLSKSYAQEYYAGAYGVGVTSTTNTGAAAALGLRRVTALQNITFDGITVTHTGASAWFAGGPFRNLRFLNVTASTKATFQSVSTWTGEMTGCNVRLTGQYTTNGTTPYWFSVAFGARDVTLQNCVFTSDFIGYVHIHEGAANITVNNVQITNAPAMVSAGNRPVIGLRGRAYNVVMTGLTVTNANNQPFAHVLFVDAGISGSMSGHTFNLAGSPLTGAPIVNNAPTTFIVTP